MQCRTTFLGSGNAVDNFLPMPMQQGYWKTRTLPWKHWKETACDLRKLKHIATHQPSMCYQIGMHLGIKSHIYIYIHIQYNIHIGIMRYTSISGCFSVHHRELGFQGKCFLGSLPSTAGWNFPKCLRNWKHFLVHEKWPKYYGKTKVVEQTNLASGDLKTPAIPSDNLSFWQCYCTLADLLKSRDLSVRAIRS